MRRLFGGKVLMLDNGDIRSEEKTVYDVSKIFKPMCRANYVLYFDDGTQELTLLKARKDIILKHSIRK